MLLFSLFQCAITSFDLLVNRAAKLTQSRASYDHTMAVAALGYAFKRCYSYHDCCQDQKKQNDRIHTRKRLTPLSDVLKLLKG
jgi:hypothetical protein